MDRPLFQDGKYYIKQQIDQLSIYHIISFFIVTTITAYILKNRLIRWIYVGIWSVFIIKAINTGQDLEAGKDIYKIATI